MFLNFSRAISWLCHVLAPCFDFHFLPLLVRTPFPILKNVLSFFSIWVFYSENCPFIFLLGCLCCFLLICRKSLCINLIVYCMFYKSSIFHFVIFLYGAVLQAEFKKHYAVQVISLYFDKETLRNEGPCSVFGHARVSGWLLERFCMGLSPR